VPLGWRSKNEHPAIEPVVRPNQDGLLEELEDEWEEELGDGEADGGDE